VFEIPIRFFFFASHDYDDRRIDKRLPLPLNDNGVPARGALTRRKQQ
jgi:hypothetical protein